MSLNAIAKKKMSLDLCSPEAIRSIQELSTVHHGAQGLAVKGSRGAVVTDEDPSRPPLMDIGLHEKLYIIGHGGIASDDIDKEERILRIRTYGGYEPRKLAEQLILLGLPLNYSGLIYLTGCAPAAGEGGGFLREFQKELQRLGIRSAVKGALDVTTPDDQGRILVKRELERTEYLASKILELEIDMLLSRIGDLKHGRLKPQEETEKIKKLKEDIKKIEDEMERSESWELIFENTRLRGKLEKLCKKVGQNLLSEVQLQYRQKAQRYQAEFFTTAPSRKLTLPGGAAHDIDTTRLETLQQQLWDNVNEQWFQERTTPILEEIQKMGEEILRNLEGL